METKVSQQTIAQAYERIQNVIIKTPLQYSERLSELYKAEVYLKREDLQAVRSYKIRGAYNLMSSLDKSEQKRGVVCASAGNHAQGFALSCSKLKIKGVVFMPEVTPRQKIDKVRKFGGKYVEIVLTGKTFDDANASANEYCTKRKMVFVHPFNDARTISGQGTVGLEIYQELSKLDMLVAPIGGGGLISGVSTYLKSKNRNIKVIGVDPAGAPKMVEALKAGEPVTLDKIDTFVDGAAVRRAGELTYKIVEELVNKVIASPEGAVCKTMIELYQNEGIIVEPAGALAVSALEFLQDKIKGKTVVCVVSGGNNDITRYPEIMERSLVYQGLKHYFLIEFAQKPGELMKFLQKVLGPGDDIVRFEYIKKTNKEKGPALVGLELTRKQDFEPLLKRMQKHDVKYVIIDSNDLLYQYLI